MEICIKPINCDNYGELFGDSIRRNALHLAAFDPALIDKINAHKLCALTSKGNIVLPTYDENAAKKASNLSINSDLLRQAKAFDINLSATLEAALKVKLKELQAQKWLDENRASIVAYNESVADDGVFSDGLRSF